MQEVLVENKKRGKDFSFFRRTGTGAMTAVEYIASNYQLRYNESLHRVEWKSEQGFKTLTPRIINTLMLDAVEHGAKLQEQAVKLFLASSRIESFNPVLEYFESIQKKCSLKKDYVLEVSKCIPCRQENWAVFFHRWLLGEVAEWVGWGEKKPAYGMSCHPLFIGYESPAVFDFFKRILPQEIKEYVAFNFAVQTDIRELKKYKENYFTILMRDGGEIKCPNAKQQRCLFIQLFSELKRGEKWWFELEEIRKIENESRRFSCMPEIMAFYKTFIPLDEVDEGARYLSLSDIAACVSYHTGQKFEGKSLNRFGRWLTAEARVGNIRKRFVNGSTSYLVKSNFNVK